ncbi:MAG: ABC transporter permease [Propionibacterium sp.]|nr:ABC transporter permease [Propionibacterium sp.]
MNQVLLALQWILDPAHFGGPSGVLARTLEHLGLTLAGVGVAAVLALPLGLWVGHTGRGRGPVIATTGAARAVPTLGLVTLFALALGIGLSAPLLALVVLALPSLVVGATSACGAAGRTVVDAARAQGMTEWQLLTRVELPLGAPLLVAGIRAATLQVVSTAMLAAYVGGGGLGRFIFLGLKTQDYPQMLAGSLLVILLAVVLDLTLALVQRMVAPAGVGTTTFRVPGTIRSLPSTSTATSGRGATAALATDTMKGPLP